MLLDCVACLRWLQPGFARTGGLHAFAAFDCEGNLLACREDIGRHNAADKVIGSMLRRGLLGARSDEPRPALLVASGRCGFEIAQKAAAARIPILAGISAPTSLAIDLAQRVGLTLAAFVRADRFNLYAHPQRLQPAGCSPSGPMGSPPGRP